MSLADSANVLRRGYFRENRKLLTESEIPSAGCDPTWQQLANVLIESTYILSQPPNVAPNVSFSQRNKRALMSLTTLVTRQTMVGRL